MRCNYEENFYYHPEKHGFVVVDELEYSDRWYQYDTRMIWRDTNDGKFYTARDAGCSCPTPFEEYGLKEDLTEICDWHHLESILQEDLEHQYDRGVREADVVRTLRRASHAGLLYRD